MPSPQTHSIVLVHDKLFLQRGLSFPCPTGDSWSPSASTCPQTNFPVWRVVTCLGAGGVLPYFRCRAHLPWGLSVVSKALEGGDGCKEGDTQDPLPLQPRAFRDSSDLPPICLLLRASKRVKLQTPASAVAGIKGSVNDLPRGRRETGPSPGPLNSEQVGKVTFPMLCPHCPPPGPSPGGTHGMEGLGRCWSPRHHPASLTHSSTVPPPCWGQAGLGRAGGRRGEEKCWRGMEGTEAKCQEGRPVTALTAVAATGTATTACAPFHTLPRRRHGKEQVSA